MARPSRGGVWLVNLDPAIGTEANKRRPAVIVSNDTNNDAVARLGRGVITVIPITSNVARVYRFQVHLPAGAGGLTEESKAQAEQIRAVDIRRLVAPLGLLSAADLAALHQAIRLHLAL